MQRVRKLARVAASEAGAAPAAGAAAGSSSAGLGLRPTPTRRLLGGIAGVCGLAALPGVRPGTAVASPQSSSAAGGLAGMWVQLIGHKGSPGVSAARVGQRAMVIRGLGDSFPEVDQFRSGSLRWFIFKNVLRFWTQIRAGGDQKSPPHSSTTPCPGRGWAGERVLLVRCLCKR